MSKSDRDTTDGVSIDSCTCEQCAAGREIVEKFREVWRCQDIDRGSAMMAEVHEVAKRFGLGPSDTAALGQFTAQEFLAANPGMEDELQRYELLLVRTYADRRLAALTH